MLQMGAVCVGDTPMGGGFLGMVAWPYSWELAESQSVLFGGMVWMYSRGKLGVSFL